MVKLPQGESRTVQLTPEGSLVLPMGRTCRDQRLDRPSTARDTGSKLRTATVPT
jgi:hypothetical protein